MIEHGGRPPGSFSAKAAPGTISVTPTMQAAARVFFNWSSPIAHYVQRRLTAAPSAETGRTQLTRAQSALFRFCSEKACRQSRKELPGNPADLHFRGRWGFRTLDLCR